MKKEKVIHSYSQMDLESSSTMLYSQSRIYLDTDKFSIIIDFKRNEIGIGNFEYIYNFLKNNIIFIEISNDKELFIDENDEYIFINCNKIKIIIPYDPEIKHLISLYLEYIFINNRIYNYRTYKILENKYIDIRSNKILTEDSIKQLIEIEALYVLENNESGIILVNQINIDEDKTSIENIKYRKGTIYFYEPIKYFDGKLIKEYNF